MRFENQNLRTWMVGTSGGARMSDAAQALCDDFSLEVQPLISAVDPSADIVVVGTSGPEGTPLVKIALPRRGVTVFAGDDKNRWAMSVDSIRPVDLPASEGRFQFSPTGVEFELFRKAGVPIFGSYESNRSQFSFFLAERARLLSTLVMIAGR